MESKLFWVWSKDKTTCVNVLSVRYFSIVESLACYEVVADMGDNAIVISEHKTAYAAKESINTMINSMRY